jgi:zinc and cadmium transporter
MSNLWWLLGGGLLMSGIAMAGSLALMLPPQWLDRLLLPLVAATFSAALA